ncbi:MAG TPA: hypothetical protein VEL31_07630 [Ktedonobacteraceae bacterium]|nr:hypothetical protein [Ktedonobacteraceae bacterium]
MCYRPPRFRLKSLWFDQRRDFEVATFLAQNAHELNEYVLFLWFNEGEGRQMALNRNGRVGARRNPIGLIGFGVDPDMQQRLEPEGEARRSQPRLHPASLSDTRERRGCYSYLSCWLTDKFNVP